MMRLFDKKWKKITAIVLGSVVLLCILVIVFISPIAKYLIEKYDEKFLGRQITLDWIYVNPFTGYAHINDLKLYEQNKDSIFVAMKGASVDFAMLKLLTKTYEISSITLDEPEIHLIQNRKVFNFSDLIARFSPKDSIEKYKPPTKFNILDVAINNGKFFYIEQVIPVNYWITDMNISTPGKRWDVDTITAKINCKSGPGTGDVDLDIVLNLKTLDYRIAALVEKFDLGIFGQYLRDLANYGTINANLDCDVKASGNFKDQLAMKAKGYLAVNDLHFGKNVGEDYVSFKKLALNMNYISPKEYEYNFDTIAIIQPYFKYERYDSLDNISRMFGVGGENIKAAKADSSKFNLIIEIADFIEVIAKNFVKSHYHANKLALYNGDIHFSDFALREQFGAAASPLNIISKDIDQSKPRLNVDVNIGLVPHGKIALGLSINPKGYRDFDITYKLEQIALPDFNPYVVTYTSFPFKSGTLEFKGNWKVRQSQIESMNHLIILNPQLTKRVRKKDTKWIPMPLILAIVRESGNYIDYEIPVKGNLNDPTIKFKDIILDVLKNIFVKPPTSPYRAYVKTQTKEVEKHQLFTWNFHQQSLTVQQERFLEKLASFLKDNKDAEVYIQPINHEAKEREHLMLYEAKKKYFLISNNKTAANYTEDDSVFVEKMSVKDTQFIAMLDKSIEGSKQMFTLQEKCRHWVDTNVIDQKLAKLSSNRKKVFMAAFKDEGVAARVKMKTEKADFPRTGFSYYQIAYKGEIPERLQKALDNLDEDVAVVLTPAERRARRIEERRAAKESKKEG
jgi:hypothetical protein